MTTQRQAKKKAGASKELAVQSWEEKLEAAILTGRQGIILAALTAWAAQDPERLLRQTGVQREFRFDPVLTARAKIVEQKVAGEFAWPLYRKESF